MDRRISPHEKFMTHLESRKKLSGSELHRTLPRTDVFTKVHFEDVGEIHIDMAIKQLCEGYAAAYRNTRHTSLMEFVLEHSRTMSMYDQAYKEMKDFKSLWHSDQKERALDKWRQWEQRSQTDLRDGDIASLAANAIGGLIYDQKLALELEKHHLKNPGRKKLIIRMNLGQKRLLPLVINALRLLYPKLLRRYLEKTEKMESNIEQELVGQSVDMNKIHPLDSLLASHAKRARQHWMRILQEYYDGKFEGFQGEEALKRFCSRVDSHTQSLIKDGKVFRAVKPQTLYHLLKSRNEKLPKTRSKALNNNLQNQALYSSYETPIHAYMCESDEGILPPQGKYVTPDTYGPVFIRLKKDNIINRSTITFNDSGMGYRHKDNEITMVPMTIDQANRNVWPLTKQRLVDPEWSKLLRSLPPKVRSRFMAQFAKRGHIYHAELSQDQNPLAVKSIHDLHSYVEVQIHGEEGLKVGDLEKVFLPRPSNQQEEEEILGVISKLDEHKIEWEYRR